MSETKNGWLFFIGKNGWLLRKKKCEIVDKGHMDMCTWIWSFNYDNVRLMCQLAFNSIQNIPSNEPTLFAKTLTFNGTRVYSLDAQLLTFETNRKTRL